MELPLIYRKVINIIKDADTDKRTTIEEEIVMRFRLSKEDTKDILKEFESNGLVKRSRHFLTIEEDVKV